jgi:putative phosphonate metabolism protein
MARYAIYFAPERDTPLWAFGCRILGRDPETGEDLEPFVPEGISAEDWQRHTASARRYGFHATLKAPFRLADGRTEDGLRKALADFGAEQAPFTVAPPALRLHGTYAALLLSEPSPEVHALGASCVSTFDDFRAALSPQERAKRHEEKLTQAQRQNLDRWGYPYVFNAFTFHMTLAGPLPEDVAETVCASLEREYEASGARHALAFRSVALYREPEGGGPLALIARAALSGKPAEADDL